MRGSAGSRSNVAIAVPQVCIIQYTTRITAYRSTVLALLIKYRFNQASIVICSTSVSRNKQNQFHSLFFPRYKYPILWLQALSDRFCHPPTHRVPPFPPLSNPVPFPSPTVPALLFFLSCGSVRPLYQFSDSSTTKGFHNARTSSTPSRAP